MLKAGLVEEIARLHEEGLLRPGVQAFRTIGVEPVFSYLDGDLSKTELKDEIIRQTWALAKRQMAWFKREKRVRS